MDEIPLSEFKERKKVIEKISKEFIESGKTMEYANTIKQAKEGISAIEENREDIKKEISNALEEYTGELLHEKIQKMSSEFINNVIQELESFSEEKESVTPKEKINQAEVESKDKEPGEKDFYLKPVQDEEEKDAEEVIKDLLNQGVWRIGKRTAYRDDIKPGNKICFYAAKTGIVATAKAASETKNKSHPDIKKHRKQINLKDIKIFDEPIELTEELRKKLSHFQGKAASGSWGWFVSTTRKLTEKDYKLLTGEI